MQRFWLDYWDLKGEPQNSITINSLVVGITILLSSLHWGGHRSAPWSSFKITCNREHSCMEPWVPPFWICHCVWAEATLTPTAPTQWLVMAQVTSPGWFLHGRGPLAGILYSGTNSLRAVLVWGSSQISPPSFSLSFPSMAVRRLSLPLLFPPPFSFCGWVLQICYLEDSDWHTFTVPSTWEKVSNYVPN